jgi:hypothetical protein
MLHNSLLLYSAFEYTERFISDSIISQGVELINHPIAVRSEVNSWGFIVFFICFFILVSIIGNRNKFLLSMFSRVFRSKERHNMFYETVTNETLNKLFLNLQNILLLSMIFYCYAIREYALPVTTFPQMMLFIGKVSLTFVLFILYKFLSYSLTGIIFFRKETVFQWNDDFFSLISLNGILLFFPTLFFFYVETAYSFFIYFFIFILIFNLFFIVLKTYLVFFQRKSRLFYFILYLCAQELIPLYLVYRGVFYIITQQKGTIWM